MLAKLRSNTFLAGSSVYLFSNILNAAIPFALLPVLTRYLTPAEYGEVAMFQTLLGALGAFVGLSIAGAAGRKYYDSHLDKGDLSRFIGSCLQILLVTSFSVFIVMFFFRAPLSEWVGLQTRWLLWAVVLSAATMIVQLRLSQWQVRKKAAKYGALQISHSLVNMIMSLLLVVWLLQGAEGRMSGQILAASTFALTALWLLKTDDLLSFFSWSPAFLKEILKFGVPLIPHIGGLFLLASVDRFVINAELGLTETGIYMVAVQLAGGMALIFDAINKAYLPWLFERLKRDRLEEKQQIVRYTYAWFGIIALGAGLAFVIGPWLVTAVAGSEYRRAGDVIGWLALGQAFGGMYLMVTNYIFYSKRTGLLSLATIASGLLNIVLLLVLIRALGLEGAAIAFSIAMAVRFLLTWWVAQKRHPMPWFDLQIFRNKA